MATYKRYGNFSADGTEFITTNPKTPRPWINYLSNGRYCLIISQGGGGFSYYLDPGVHRLTRWTPAGYLSDKPGRFLYLKDEVSGKFWSATFQPVKRYDSYECRHGLGYTKIKSIYNGIQSEMTFFVPTDKDIEIWLIKLTNLSKKTRKIKVFPFIEWLLGDWGAELHVRNLTVLMNDGKYDKKLKAILATKFPWGNVAWPYYGFMGTSLKTEGYDIDYEDFIGRYRDYENPVVVESGRCTNSEVRGGNMVGALESDITLRPGAAKEFSVVVGLSEDKAKIKKTLDSYRNINNAKREFERTKNYWRGAILDNIKVRTPDRDFDRQVNIWIKYQVYMNNHWGRSATYQHEGWGEFGYRNTAQDAWAMTSMNAKYAKERLIKLAEHQRKNGQPLPGWSLVKGTNAGKPPSDFPIWLPMLLIKYVKETGDLAILKRKIKFYDGGSASLYEHAKRATQFLMDVAKSKRGLPLMGTQDWNDAFDRTGIGGKGESVWLGMGLCVALNNMKELAAYLKDGKTVVECRNRYEKMKAIINKYAWDGNWYCYAFNDYGEPIGSNKNKEDKVQLNAQSWAILAGIPDEKKLKKILKVVDGYLATPYGPVLFKPAYTKYNGRIGRITAFAPGTKENAAIFCHGGAFKVVSDLKIGRAKEAYKTFKQTLPCSDNKDIEIYKSEPYIYPEYVIGPGNHRYGEGAFTWLTGSADWMFVAATEWMLGIRPEFDGLLIDPCIPNNWKRYVITRRFRGATYQITIENPKGRSKGIKEILVDGRKLDGCLIPPHRDGKIHHVKVLMN
ncbi:MAG: glycosyl transferase family 36 [Candidatus Omnitrophota bacterium]|nr:glycosyl transferase family 36 [Candidatus Omnitrophota bacterium]